MQLNEETEFHLPKRCARERSIQYFIELRFGPKAIGAALAKIVADASAAVNGKVRATIDRDRLSYRLTAQGAREGVCPARIDHSAQAEHQIGYDRLFLEYRETNMNAAVNVSNCPATSGAATQSAVLPAVGGWLKIFRPEKKLVRARSWPR